MNNRFSSLSGHEEGRDERDEREDGGSVDGGGGDGDGGSSSAVSCYEGVELSPIKKVVTTQSVDRRVNTRNMV